MFENIQSKQISTLLRTDYRDITSGLANAFRVSISGTTREIAFLQKLLTNLTNFINTINIPGIYFSLRSHSIHQKPLVTTKDGKCELGDLLVVVKYYLSQGSVEAKSIIYQIKLTQQQNSRICNIDQRQLTLLCEWPSFTFGGVTYDLSPRTIEFGSFMLEPRNPLANTHSFGRFSCYGKCPHSGMVKRQQSPYDTVNIDHLPYTRPDANNFFSHLAFEIGEHHNNQAVGSMINALYRFVGLEPDPPDEFKGSYGHSEDDGFAVLEIGIKSKHKSNSEAE